MKIEKFEDISTDIRINPMKPSENKRVYYIEKDDIIAEIELVRK